FSSALRSQSFCSLEFRPPAWLNIAIFPANDRPTGPEQDDHLPLGSDTENGLGNIVEDYMPVQSLSGPPEPSDTADSGAAAAASAGTGRAAGTHFTARTTTATQHNGQG